MGKFRNLNSDGNSQSGFTLVELMVVVAITGILASVATMNIFKYVERVKVVQGKSALSELYTAEKVFHSEYLSYTSRLDALGYKLVGNTYWDIGFGVDFAPPAEAPQGTNNCNQVCLCPGLANCLDQAQNGLDVGTTATISVGSFMAIAHGHFGSAQGVAHGNPKAGSKTISINDSKNITEVSPAK